MDNLVNSSFQLNKILRAIRVANRNFVFCRYVKNKFGEIDFENYKIAKELKGIFHISSSFQQNITSDAGTNATVEQPMILALYNDAMGILKDDFVFLNENKIYKVVDVIDLGELHIVCEISLEVCTTIAGK